MPVPTVITDLSTTAASNYPAGTDSPSTLDDVQRAHASFIRALYNGDTTLYLPAGTGAVPTTVQAKLRESVSVFDFMTAAQIADVQAGTLGVDVTAAINAAITAVNLAGGGTVFVPKGTYKCVSTVSMKKNVSLIGVGVKSSVLTFSNTGDGISMVSVINSSVAVNTVVKDLSIICTNNSNTGGGYVDVGGTFVNLSNVRFNGFKYQVIFDQTELAEIDLCIFESPLLASVWLVNGADHTVGANMFFTNRISITRCQFNSNDSFAYAIVDDGGVSHSIDKNNFNGYGVQIRGAGQKVASITNNYFSSDFFIPLGSMVKFYGTTLAGGSVGGYSVLIESNQFAPIFASAAIEFVDSNDATICNNQCTGVSGYPIIVTSINSIVSIGNSVAGSPSAIYSSVAAIRHYSADVGYSPYSKSGLTFLNATTSTGVASTGVLNNYEEGTWTPTIYGSTTAGVTTYTTQSGSYTRIGRLVFIQAYINWSNQTGTGNLNLGGLPYVVKNSNDLGVIGALAANLTYTASNQVGVVGVNNTTTAQLIQFSQGAALGAIPIDTTAQIYISGCYLANTSS